MALPAAEVSRPAGTCVHPPRPLQVKRHGHHLQVEDKKYLAAGVRLDGWREWFEEQMGWAKVQKDRGLYVGLRLDGRVRASGKGCPPWAQFAVELAPMEGMWKGFFDGMDGVV